MPYFLRSSQPNSNLKAAKQALKGVDYIIIDEISLVLIFDHHLNYHVSDSKSVDMNIY